MSRRLKRWIFVGLAALVLVGVALAAANLPYLPFVHGTMADEVERLASWLEVQPGMRIADLGAGGGRFTIALARRVGPSGHVYAIEVDRKRLADLKQAASAAQLSNITVIEGAESSTNLPEGCCDALFSRVVYHHLTDAAAINASIFRVLRPGARLLVIDFEPGGIMNWIGLSASTERQGGHGTRKETVVNEVTAAGFQRIRGPEYWRGRIYGVLFKRP